MKKIFPIKSLNLIVCVIDKLEETTDIIQAIESNKGYLIKDNDSRQELKIRGFGEG